MTENDTENTEKASPGFDKKEAWEWIKSIGLAVIIAWFILTFVIVNAYVPSGSMETTIMTNDRIIALRPYYMFNDPKRGDIAVFKFPDDESLNYVKRIIGLPGETVEVKGGAVYINGNKIDEPYLKVVTEGNFGPYKVPEGKYFMMGDNRNSSLDSRFWQNKAVDRNKILGRVFIEYFPRPQYLGNK